MDSMLLIEDLSDDDIYSNSNYSSFWSIEACGESPYSYTWSMDTSRDSRLFTSICSSDSICSDSSYRSIWSSKTYTIVTCDRFAPPLTDTFSDSSSIEDFDTQGELAVSKEQEIDGTNNICHGSGIPTTNKQKQNVFKHIGKCIKRLITCIRRSNKVFPFPM